MKTFRIKLNNKETYRSSFEFILLKNCKQINMSYSILEQVAKFELYTLEEKSYSLSQIMKPFDFQLLELRFNKFKSNNDFFFDLGDFVVKVETIQDNKG